MKKILFLSLLVASLALAAAFRVRPVADANESNALKWVVAGTADDTSEVLSNMGVWGGNEIGQHTVMVLFRKLTPTTSFAVDTMICAVYWQMSMDALTWFNLDTMSFNTQTTAADTLPTYKSLRIIPALKYRIIADGLTGNDSSIIYYTLSLRE